MRKPGERQIQETVIEWSRWQKQKYPSLKWLHSNRNEATSIGERVKGEKMGIKKGIWDLFLPKKAPKPFQIPGQIKRYYSGLYIELKYGKGKLRPEQEDFQEFAVVEGFKCVVCWTADDAIKEIEIYLLEVKA